MAWPTVSGVTPGQKINAQKIKDIIEALPDWQGNVDAHGYHLYRSADLPIVSHYDFAPISPAVSLTGSTPATVALTPFPPGITAASPGLSHKLLITDGVGGNEVVTVTAVNPGVSVTFTPASNHTSGNWAIQSATAGLQEGSSLFQSLQALPGQYDMYGTFTPPTGFSLLGAGRGCVEFEMHTDAIKAFNVIRDGVTLHGFKLTGPSSAASGSIGIYVAGNASGVSGAAGNYALMFDINIVGFYDGWYGAGGGGAVDLFRVQVNNCERDGFVGKSPQGNWYTCLSLNNARHGVLLAPPDGGGPSGASPFILGLQVFGCGGWGVYSTAMLTISDSYLNNDKLGEIFLGDTLLVDNGYVDNTYIQFSGDTAFFGDDATAPGVQVAHQTNGGALRLSNLRFYATNGIAINVASNQCEITGCVVNGPGITGTSGHKYSLKVTGVGNSIHHNFFNGPVLIDAGQNYFSENDVSSGDAALPVVHVLSGGLVLIHLNRLYHTTPSSSALTIASGVTYLKARNYILSGTINNSGSLAAYDFDLT